MGFFALFLILLAFLPAIPAQKTENATFMIDTNVTVAETDDCYICATIDYGPQDHCSYGRCPWRSSSMLNIDLSNPNLTSLVKAFKKLRLRLGGSLQDQLIYNVGNLSSPCHQFKKDSGGLFGYSEGCLNMERWDQLHKFVNETGAIMTFGLNALYGRQRMRKGVWGGNWDSSNARDFINYTISRGYRIDSWEFGNELSGKGIGASVDSEQYGKDLIRLNAMIDELYKDFEPKPSVMAPGGFYDKSWFDKLLQVSGPDVVNFVSHHIYNLGAGDDQNLQHKILDPDYLSKSINSTFNNLNLTIQENGPWAAAWVGESGGVFNGGSWDVSNTFLNTFWYLDQLGMAATYNTKVYCRQTFVGGFYGLLDETTFVPNPDYYSALLWHRLMGKGVFAFERHASPYLRAYAHCTPKYSAGITLLLINLSNDTTYNVDIHPKSSANISPRKFYTRNEYHLTPENGDLWSKNMLINGRPVYLSETGKIHGLIPFPRDLNSPLTITPLSIKFVVFHNFNTPSQCH